MFQIVYLKGDNVNAFLLSVIFYVTVDFSCFLSYLQRRWQRQHMLPLQFSAPKLFPSFDDYCSSTGFSSYSWGYDQIIGNFESSRSSLLLLRRRISHFNGFHPSSDKGGGRTVALIPLFFSCHRSLVSIWNSLQTWICFLVTVVWKFLVSIHFGEDNCPPTLLPLC